MKRTLRTFFRSFIRSTDGVAAIEFAIVTPLLLMLLASGIELGLAYQAHRMFENTVTGIGRAIAGSPEYDARLRKALPLIGSELLPPNSSGRFHLQVTSFVREEAAMVQLYTHTAFGTNPDVQNSSSVDVENFEQNESIIHIAAAYDVVPIFPFMPGFRLTKTHSFMPYFARKHVWNAGNSADKYVN